MTGAHGLGLTVANAIDLAIVEPYLSLYRLTAASGTIIGRT